MLFDDYEAASTSVSFGTLIYTLAQGESKIRCNHYGECIPTYRWRTFIGLTGESSIFSRAGNNLGLRPRIVEFKNVKWTSSKENSINITSVVSKHYGFYGEEFVRGLENKTQEELEKLYSDCEGEINKLLPPINNISERIQTRLAIILATAKLVKEILKLDIDVDGILSLLVENEKKRQTSLDVFELAKESVAEFINRNLASFIRYDDYTKTTKIPSSGTIAGRIYKGRQGNFVAILPESFDKIFAIYNDKEAILERWRDEHFLITDNDNRFTKKVSMNSFTNTTPRCYVFLLKDIAGLEQKLKESDAIVVQDFDDDDFKEYAKSAKTICQNGIKYVQLPNQNEPRSEIFFNPHCEMHDFAGKVELPKVELPKVVLEVCETKYDDEEQINEIFNDESASDSSKGE